MVVVAVFVRLSAMLPLLLLLLLLFMFLLFKLMLLLNRSKPSNNTDYV